MQKGPSPTISFDFTIQIRHTFPKCSAKLPAEHFFRDKAINDGEIFGIIGFSGAGKTTLVGCINLLGRPTSGSVKIDGVDLIGLSPKELREERKKIGMIFQHFNLMPSRTVFGNVAFPLKGSGLSKDEIKQKVRKLLSLVDLSDKENAYPSELSGGQKQRVAYCDKLQEKYTHKRELFCDGLAYAGLRFQRPEGAYYVMADISEWGYDSDLQFCYDLAEKVGVGAVPGSSFFHEPVNHLIRFHFAKKDETLKDALNRLQDIHTKLKK